MVEGAVVLDVQAYVVNIAILYGLVVAEHQDGHSGGIVELAAGDPVAQAAHHHPNAVLHLDAVEIMDAAVFHIIVSPDYVFPVSSGQLDGSGSEVVEVAARQTTGTAPAIYGGRHMTHPVDDAILNAGSRTACNDDSVASGAGQLQPGNDHIGAAFQSD